MEYAPSSEDPLATRRLLAADFYEKAWGKPWPTDVKVLDQADYLTTEGTTIDIDTGLHINHDYVCFKDLDLLNDAILMVGTLPNVVVRLECYNSLIRMLESSFYGGYSNAFAVTGQPGIGKKTFLLCLLLHRLERRLPTALQLHNLFYVIFDENGSALCPVGLQEERLRACWALSAGNSYVDMPCEIFRLNAPCVVHVASPFGSGWKPWLEQKEGLILVMDLPEEKDVMAIAKENGYASFTHRVPAIVRKWGPSVRLALNFALEHRSGRLATAEESHEASVRTSAYELYHDPESSFAWFALKMREVDHICSVVFMRPRSANDLEGWVHFVPTEHLQGILEDARGDVSNEWAIELLAALNVRSSTQSFHDLEFECRAHRRLCTGSEDLHIVNDGRTLVIQPSSVLLPSTFDALRSVDQRSREGAFDAFYWLPSLVDLPGIDGVLGDNAGNIFAICNHAAARSVYTRPDVGLQTVWDTVDARVRAHRRWHFVVLSDKLSLADQLLWKVTEDISNSAVVQEQSLQISVWASSI